jgi:hypothetical protein
MSANTSLKETDLPGSRLNYMNLHGVGFGSSAMNAVGTQLKPYRDYLRTAMKAAERAKPCLAWRPADAEEISTFDMRWLERQNEKLRRDHSRHRRHQREEKRDLPSGDWIVLEPPPDRPETAEEIFDAFLNAQEVYDDQQCSRDTAIEKIDYDREGRALFLKNSPKPVEVLGLGHNEPDWVNLIWLRSDTYALSRQLKAVEALDNAPCPRHAPLTRLMVMERYTQWPDVSFGELNETDWLFLDAPQRNGTDQQRRFVEIALHTPDFALLEGPPGSGKTTAICELITQLARQGKRVLLVASTHVAVDNVLERLLAWQDNPNTHEKLVLPVRIGDESKVTSDEVEPWCYHRLLRTWRANLQDFLERPGETDPRGNAARRMLLQALREGGENGSSAISNLLLESSNLVCGTTIGILQHPAIKNAWKDNLSFEPFDMMILDEASKTTLSEFLVPALHAKRWVVVGDIKQLSPYVETQYLEDNLRGLLPHEQAEAALHGFMAKKSPRWIAVEDDKQREFLTKECGARAIHLLDLDAVAETEVYGVPGAITELLYADLIIGKPETLSRFQHRLPVDLVAGAEEGLYLEDWETSHTAWKSTQSRFREYEQQDWAEAVAWRLVRSYELRQNETERKHHDGEVEGLIPKSLNGDWFRFRGIKEQRRDGLNKQAADEIQRELKNLRRCAFPSILELLQRGFERVRDRDEEAALTDGLPNWVLSQRLVSLSYQHRMHPDISGFPRDQFYTLRNNHQHYTEWGSEESQLLKDASNMSQSRMWDYHRYAKRAVWTEVLPERGRRRGRGNENVAEVKVTIRELQAFVEWATSHPRPDGKPWEVAVLTFYRAQEKLLRGDLQRLGRARGNSRNFKLPAENAVVHVTLCTVDRFQGHEADMVLLSFVKSGSVGFLNSPNRLNVALTRARYQLVLIGHRAFFESERHQSDLLRALASSQHYPAGIAYLKS